MRLTDMNVADLKARLREHGQEHLLPYLDAAEGDERRRLYDDLARADLAELRAFYLAARDSLDESAQESLADSLEPADPRDCGSSVRAAADELDAYRRLGLQKVADGQVAVLLLAGGQGTRLGVDYPKGMYDVGLASGKTLYQLQGERLFQLQRLAYKCTGRRGVVPWYIMTSDATKESSQKFFKTHNYFGLEESNVTFFEQGTLPCLTFDGQIILEPGYRMAKAPDGNGGLYRALDRSGVLADMQRRDVRYVHVYCVDNILVKMADPAFIGFCISKNAQCGAKVVEKTTPNESVGVICRVNQKYRVVEYSELPAKACQKRSSDGRLKYNGGNICNHFFTIEFLQDVVRRHESQLKHHVAKKKIPYMDLSGKLVKPSTPNGIKLEKFVFDVFSFAERMAIWEVRREDEFAPLKNADTEPKDSPSAARRAVHELHLKYLQAAGGKVGSDQQRNGSGDECNGCSTDRPANGGGEPCVAVEISPLLSYDGEDLRLYVEGKVLETPLLVASAAERSDATLAAKARNAHLLIVDSDAD